MNNAIPLIVGSFNGSDDEQSSCMHENRCSDKEQLKNIDVKSTWKANSWNNRRSFIYSDPRIRKPYSIQGPGTLSKETINFSKRRIDLEYDEQRLTNCKMSSNQKKLDAKQYNESNEIKVRRMDEQTESKDVDVQGELNASLQHCSDALPPLWFTKYMESVSAANFHLCIFISAVFYNQRKFFPELIYLHKIIIIYYSLISCITILMLTFG